jgi:hypothetical protein
MGKAQRDGGLYYTDKGVAVDAEGKKIEDAPKQKPDTDPSKQPGAAGGAAPGTMTMRLDDDSLRALGGKVPAKPKAEAETKSDDEEDDVLPTIKDLPAAVAKLKSVEEVKAMAKRDDRVSAEPIYDARIAEL